MKIQHCSSTPRPHGEPATTPFHIPTPHLRGQLTLEALLAFLLLLSLLAILSASTSRLFSQAVPSWQASQERELLAAQSLQFGMYAGAYRFVSLPSNWSLPSPSSDALLHSQTNPDVSVPVLGVSQDPRVPA